MLAARTIVYALAPRSVLLAALAHREGGPQLAGVLVAAVLAGAGAAVTVLWLAVVAVRERLALEGRRLVESPRLSLPRLAARACALFLVTCAAFAITESIVHWREGLGWHGLHCLTGPVHRDAIPILAALSLVAVAVHGAVEHLLAWARRLVAQLAARLHLPPPVPPGAPARVNRRARASRSTRRRSRPAGSGRPRLLTISLRGERPT